MNYIVKTDVGVVRSENQDRAAVFRSGDITFSILCDGMGGHMGGSHASSITIATFEKEFSRSFPRKTENVEKWFQRTITKTKKEMTRFADKDPALLDMGTTVTAAVIMPDLIKIFNVGDSRTYIYNGLLHQITKDHNLRNHYIKEYGYSEEKAATLMGATALIYALGPKKKSHIDVFRVANDENVKSVIHTSDGIHDYIAKPTFESIISGADTTLEDKAELLLSNAIRGKSSDNLTAIIVEVK